MGFIEEQFEQTAAAIGIDVADLRDFVERGQNVTYAPGDVLFHESTPRQWFGIVETGEVEIVCGLHGATTHLSTVGAGGMLSEGILLDDSAHSTTGIARKGATVLQIPRSEVDALKASKPDVYYRLVARVARRMSDRLRHTAEQAAGRAKADRVMMSVRREHDSLGERELPNDVYYGVQTLRGLENFPISGIPLRNFDHLITALAFVKKAAALANSELGVLAADRADAIAAACDELLAGELRDNFVVDVMQGGAGTSTNMNANEVLANRGLELLGHAKGEYAFLHPNDDVNCSQSTNDAYPTAVKIGVILSLKDTLGAMRELAEALEAKAAEFAAVIKMGRTENQDAVPMTLGQEFGAYAVTIRSAMRSLERAGDELHEINMGATAIGTGLNSPPGYAELVTTRLQEVSGLPLRKAEDLVEATHSAGAFVQMSANMKRAAVQVSKICNDLRWMSSGPRCGLYEIRLPAMQPGSSIMPGKVNPVIPEVVSQICYQIIGYDMTISMAAEAGELELNMAEPIMAFDLLHGLMILKNACVILASRCVAGIEANVERCRQMVENSIGLVTALNPVLGYERSSAVAKEALATGGSVYDLVLAKEWLTKDALDELLKPENMTAPRRLAAP
jgi:aspartate ammonia-lyase